MTAFVHLEDRPGPMGWVILGGLAGLVAAVTVSLAGPLLTVALIVGLVSLVGAIAAPGIVFAAYLLIAFYKGAIQDYSPLDITVFLALANAVQVVPLVIDARRRNVSPVGVALWISLGLLVVGGVIYAPDQSLALGKAITYWALVVLPIIPAALRVGAERRYLDQFLWTFFFMGGLTVLLGLAQLSGSDRLVVLGMNTIQVSRAALLVPLLAIAYVVPQRRLGTSLVAIVLIPAAIVVAIASGSRGPLLVVVVMAVAGVVRYLVKPRAARWRMVGACVGIVLVSVAVLSTVGPDLPVLSLGRFASLADFIQAGLSGDAAMGGETSASARVRLFQYAAALWADHPLLGAGTAGFEALSPGALGVQADTYPHNAVLQVASEYGLVGLALFIGVIAVALVRGLPGRFAGFTVRALFIFFLLNAMVSGDIFTDRETLGLLFLILAIEAPRVIGLPAASSPAATRPPPGPGSNDVRQGPHAIPPWLEPVP